MWLQWVLQQLRTPDLIREALGLTQTWAQSESNVTVQREFWVVYSNGATRGRLDIVVWQGSEMRCALEIKTKPFLDESLAKQSSYVKSRDVPTDAEKIFIAAESGESDLRGFRFLSWAELCLRLRRLAPAVAATRGCVTAALVLAYIGAIEQNILGFAQPSGEQFLAFPQTMAHLSRFLDRPL